jgi:hypothetical protein
MGSPVDLSYTNPFISDDLLCASAVKMEQTKMIERKIEDTIFIIYKIADENNLKKIANA